MNILQGRYKAVKLVRDFLGNKLSLTDTLVSGLTLSKLQLKILQSDAWSQTTLDVEDSKTILKTQALRFEKYNVEKSQTDNPSNRIVVYPTPRLKMFTNFDEHAVLLHKGEGWPALDFNDPSVDKLPTDEAISLTQKIVTLASELYKKNYRCTPTALRDGKVFALPKLDPDYKWAGANAKLKQ